MIHITKKPLFLLGILAAVAVAIGFYVAVTIKDMPLPKNAAFIGSAACAKCHGEEHTAWRGSMHAKMMRRIEEPGAVVADFKASDRPFDKNRAVWVIGNRWEQQFMGHDGKTETLLPGAWLVDKGKWETTGWDGWQVPVPLQRCHGCHTVGLDVKTGEFTEPGIGCESCHGPGSWHRKTFGLGKIASTPDAQVCGQCHTRGRAVDGGHFFPVGYRIGEPLAKYFKETEPTLGQTSAAWWGNGREHKRHQEYYAWRQGGHADSLQRLKTGYDGRYGEVTSDCLRCHAAKAALLPERVWRPDETKHGITCAVCHPVHGELDKPRYACGDCHQGGAYYHRPERNEDHVVCGEKAGVTCVDCHMPLTGKNGGGLNLHTHHPGIIPPADTRQYGVPNSCANGGCHTHRDIQWLQDALARHYGVSAE
ncbi:MAG: Cytochrome c554 and c-prime [Candidatus Kentron sp. G]|nr:MAG: Cytochrome c554 and c-prime [Candidatus Kentron sp. G]VFM95982.1 MAG: Cytochrome c554 and c-prime [Candidatus Kentron sp. G]VFM97817.1 MAG: Cytochrome c554 and c-prime [Candidatus Kentron sp. G]